MKIKDLLLTILLMIGGAENALCGDNTIVLGQKSFAFAKGWAIKELNPLVPTLMKRIYHRDHPEWRGVFHTRMEFFEGSFENFLRKDCEGMVKSLRGGGEKIIYHRFFQFNGSFACETQHNGKIFLSLFTRRLGKYSKSTYHQHVFNFPVSKEMCRPIEFVKGVVLKPKSNKNKKC